MIFVGVDVGFSEIKSTVGICAITIDRTAAMYRCSCTTEDELPRALEDLLQGSGEIAAIGVDGPLTRGLKHTEQYRLAEALLSRGLFQKRCKPGQTSSPVGQKLHHAATSAARGLLRRFGVTKSGGGPKILPDDLYETFPNAFLGVMLHEAFWRSAPDGRIARGRKSDIFWDECLADGTLEKVAELALGAPANGLPLSRISDHDERAAFVCALAAAGARIGRSVAVGDSELGYISLPPMQMWANWARQTLRQSYTGLRKKGDSCEVWRDGRLLSAENNSVRSDVPSSPTTDSADCGRSSRSL